MSADKDKDQTSQPDDSDTVKNIFLRDADEVVRPIEKVGFFSHSAKRIPSLNENKNSTPKPGKS